MSSEEGLLFLEPAHVASATPRIDQIPRRMCAAFGKARRASEAYRGIHECFCGANSTAFNDVLPQNPRRSRCAGENPGSPVIEVVTTGLVEHFSTCGIQSFGPATWRLHSRNRGRGLPVP